MKLTMKRNIVFTIAAVMAVILTLCACGGKEEAPAVEFDTRTLEQAPATALETVPETVEFSVDAMEPVDEVLPEQDPVSEAPQTAEPETEEPDPSFLTDILAQGLLEKMGAFTEEDIFDYYGIDPARCSSVFAYADSEGSAKEVVYAQADAEYIPEIETLLRNHLDARAEQYAGYDAEGAKMIRNASLVTGQTSVFMVVAPDTAPYLTIFDAYKG